VVDEREEVEACVVIKDNVIVTSPYVYIRIVHIPQN
jgi:hypothetical protein